MFSRSLFYRVKYFNSVNPFIRYFVLAEVLLWSAWSFISPIFALFVTSNISGGDVQVAASSFSIYYIVRIFVELATGKLMAKVLESIKVIVILFGLLIISFAYINFALASTVPHIYISWIIAGFGFGIIAPVKLSIFSTHLDKDRESEEWGVYDALSFASMAIAATLGGLIAKEYGFRNLFLSAAFINVLSTLPYAFYGMIKRE